LSYYRKDDNSYNNETTPKDEFISAIKIYSTAKLEENKTKILTKSEKTELTRENKN